MAIKGHRTVIDTDSVALYSHKIAIGTGYVLTDRVINIRLIIEIKTKSSFHNTDSM